MDTTFLLSLITPFPRFPCQPAHTYTAERKAKQTMTETAPVPETPTNVKLEPVGVKAEAPSENDPHACNARIATDVTEGPAEPVVKAEQAEVKREAVAPPEPTTPVVKEKEPTADDLAKIKQLLLFYFGDANYRRDKFLKNEAAKDPEGALA